MVAALPVGHRSRDLHIRVLFLALFVNVSLQHSYRKNDRLVFNMDVGGEALIDVPVVEPALSCFCFPA